MARRPEAPEPRGIAGVSADFRAVVLDVDGLLLDTERVIRTAWRDAGASLGVAIDDALYAQLLGLTDAVAVARLAATFGPTFSPAVFLPLAIAETERRLHREPVPLRPGADEMLACLDAHAVPWAIATSTRRIDAVARLARAGIWSRIAVSVCGDEVPSSKPAPDIYLRAAELLGVPATACVALEDSSAGALAAAGAGMTTILVPDLAEPATDVRAVCAAVVPSLIDVVAWIDSARRS